MEVSFFERCCLTDILSIDCDLYVRTSRTALCITMASLTDITLTPFLPSLL